MPAPAGWTVVSSGGWDLHHHPLLPAIRLLDTQRRHRGWLIGYPLDGDHMISGDFQVVADGDDVGFADAVGSRIDNFGGRWACAITESPKKRVYLDAAGTLSAVYRTDKQVVASTPTTAHWDHIDEFVETCRQTPELPPNAYFIGPATRTPETRRLLPNFYFDLDTWRPVRHWPRAPLPSVSLKQATPLVLSAIGDNLLAVRRKFEIFHGLSAGRDTRLVLAAARERKVDIRYYTFPYDDPYKVGDAELAQQIAQRLRLEHRVIPLGEPTRQMRDEYLFRVGFCANSGKTVDQYDACQRALDMSQAMGIGYGGEVGRGYYWRFDRPGTRPNAEILLKQMHLVYVNDQQLAAASEWLETIPSFVDVPTLLDLAYLELRIGCWASAQMYGAAPIQCYFSPIVRRDVFANLMGLPQELRRTQEGVERIAKAALPEISDIPYTFNIHNRPQVSFVRRGLSFIKRKLVSATH